MSYMTGRPKGALPAIVPGFSGVGHTGCSCPMGDAGTPQGAGPVIKVLAILAVGYFAVTEMAKSFKKAR